MVKRKKAFTEDHYQAVVLIAMLMNEMAISDKYESLVEAGTIDPPIIDRYARYSSAALEGVEKYRQLSVGCEQTAEGVIYRRYIHLTTISKAQIKNIKDVADALVAHELDKRG